MLERGLCNCDTKTPDPKQHLVSCPVRLKSQLDEAEARLALYDKHMEELGAKLRTRFAARQDTTIADAMDMVDTLKGAMLDRLNRHGYGLAAGPHEVFGILAEEMAELTDEMRANDHRKFQNELVDIAIAAVFGMLTMQQYRRHNEEHG